MRGMKLRGDRVVFVYLTQHDTERKQRRGNIQRAVLSFQILTAKEEIKLSKQATTRNWLLNCFLFFLNKNKEVTNSS